MRSAISAACFLFTIVQLSCGNAKNRNQAAPRQTSNPPGVPMVTNKNEEDTMATSGRLTLTSTAFGEGEKIPRKYTCDGENVSPPLIWQGVPSRTKSLALIVDDPDAPAGIWVHWVIFNMPPAATGLPENVPTGKSLPDGSLQGKNDSREIGYDGPCPPGGTHRYYFKLYGLDAMLNLSAGITKPELLKAMEGHIVAQAQLMGRYSRP